MKNTAKAARANFIVIQTAVLMQGYERSGTSVSDHTAYSLPFVSWK